MIINSIRAMFGVLCLLAMMASASVAQTVDVQDQIDQWNATAARAVLVLDKAVASNPALESLRNDLSEHRAAAQTLREAGIQQAALLSTQLLALGAAPDNGASESVEIAALRSKLTADLAQANIPVIEGNVAYSRAVELINRIDTLIRTRINEQIITIGPTPLDTSRWGKAYSELRQFTRQIMTELADTFSNPVSKAAIIQRLPVFSIAILIAIALLLGLRSFVARGLRLLTAKADNHSNRLGWALLLSALRIIIPGIAAIIIAKAVEFIDITGFHGEVLVNTLPELFVVMIATYWLAHNLTGGHWATRKVGIVAPELQRASHRIVWMLGTVLMLETVADAVVSKLVSSPESTAIYHFPITLMGSFFLYRAARLIKLSVAAAEQEKPDGFNAAFLGTIRRVLKTIAIVSPILAALGYFAASRFLLYPAIMSLALLSTAYVLFSMFVEITERWISPTKDGDKAQELGLFPVIFGFSIAFAALPVLALIWGARSSDLTEIWVWLNEGVSLGDSRISIKSLFIMVLVFSLGYTAIRSLQKVFRNSVLPRTSLDTGGKNAILSGISYVGFTIAALAAIMAAGIDLSSLAIVAGALSLGIGFGLQNVVSNFVSGIILLIERPIKEGDWIEVGAYSGYVRRIAVRSTVIETFERAEVIIPNADLISGTVLNWTHGNVMGRVKIPVGVAYGTDPRLVEKILMGIAKKHPMVLHNPGPSVVFHGFGADSMDFEIRVFLRDINWMLSAKSDMNYEIVRQFAEHDIEIPFAQRDIHIKNIDVLADALKVKPVAE